MKTIATESSMSGDLPDSLLKGEAEPFLHRLDDDTFLLNLMVDDVHCGACVRKVENRVNALHSVEQARLNLTTRRLAVTWLGSPKLADDIVAAIAVLGYRARPYDPSVLETTDDSTERERSLLSSVQSHVDVAPLSRRRSGRLEAGEHVSDSCRRDLICVFVGFAA